MREQFQKEADATRGVCVYMVYVMLRGDFLNERNFRYY
jgi:hypothetical protein